MYTNRGLTTDYGMLVDGIFGFHRMLKAQIDRYPGKTIIVAWDGGSRRRKQILSSYKHRRDEYDDKGVKQPANDEKKQKWEQIQICKNLCDIVGIPSVWVPGLEGDDIIGLISRANEDVTVISTDRDFYQLLAIPSLRLDRGRLENQLLDRDAFIAKHGLTPLQFRLTRSILGDKGDDVPKAIMEGSELGKESAARFSRRFSDEELRPMNWHLFYERALEMGGKYAELAARRVYAMVNFHLVDLLDVPLADNWQLLKLRKQLDRRREFDEDQYLEFLSTYQFRQALKNYDGFAYVFSRAYRDARSVQLEEVR
jgi:5'-3' exonuclease